MQNIQSNCRANDIHCALGLSQMTKLGTFVSAQNKLTEYYQQWLKVLALIGQPIKRTENGRPAWHVSVALIDFERAGTDRASVMNALRKKGISSQLLYIPFYRQPYYKRLYGAHRMAGAESYYTCCLCLPFFTDVTLDDFNHIVGSLASVLSISAD